MRHLIFSIILLFTFTVNAHAGAIMKVGQKYSFEMKGHPNPHFIVCKIDEISGKSIVSIYIGGLKFKNPHQEGGVGTSIGHAPVDMKTLIAAGIKLIEENVKIPDDYEEGYKTWKSAFDAGQAGIFDIGPDKIASAIISIVEQK